LNLRPLRPEPRAGVSPTGVEHARAASSDSEYRRGVAPLLYFAAVLAGGRLAPRVFGSAPLSRGRLVGLLGRGRPVGQQGQCVRTRATGLSGEDEHRQPGVGGELAIRICGLPTGRRTRGSCVPRQVGLGDPGRRVERDVTFEDVRSDAHVAIDAACQVRPLWAWHRGQCRGQSRGTGQPPPSTIRLSGTGWGLRHHHERARSQRAVST
jgi:hypothetical protein